MGRRVLRFDSGFAAEGCGGGWLRNIREAPEPSCGREYGMSDICRLIVCRLPAGRYLPALPLLTMLTEILRYRSG